MFRKPFSGGFSVFVVPVLLLCCVFFAACSEDVSSTTSGENVTDSGDSALVKTSDAGPDTGNARDSQQDGETRLDIVVTNPETDESVSASLICDEQRGTGFLADPASVAKACRVLVFDQPMRDYLRNGPDPDRVCTEIYGGPQQASLRGTLDGEPVDAVVTRTDGCEIADWDVLLAPLLEGSGLV